MASCRFCETPFEADHPAVDTCGACPASADVLTLDEISEVLAIAEAEGLQGMALAEGGS